MERMWVEFTSRKSAGPFGSIARASPRRASSPASTYELPLNHWRARPPPPFISPFLFLLPGLHNGQHEGTMHSPSLATVVFFLSPWRAFRSRRFGPIDRSSAVPIFWSLIRPPCDRTHTYPQAPSPRPKRTRTAIRHRAAALQIGGPGGRRDRSSRSKEEAGGSTTPRALGDQAGLHPLSLGA